MLSSFFCFFSFWYLFDFLVVIVVLDLLQREKHVGNHCQKKVYLRYGVCYLQ